MNKKSIIALAISLAFLPLMAGNSVFSFYGMPYQYYGVDTYSMGMGDAGSADVFRYNTGYANPAQHNLSNRTLFSTGMLLGYTFYKSDTHGEQSYRDDALDFPYFSVSVPVSKHRIGFQFSSLSSGVVNNSISLEDVSVIEKHAMDRYMYRADLVYSYAMGPLSLGLSGNQYLGHDIHRFAQEGGFGNFNTMEKLSNSYKNASFTAGAIYRSKMLALGAYYSKGSTLYGEQIRSSIHETEAAVDYEHNIPDHYNVSLAIVPKDKLKLALDLDYEPWSSANPDMLDSWKVALGFAYEPPRDNYRNTLANIPYRMGVSYRKLPFTAVADNEISEISASAGLSIPLKKDVNRIDLGLRYTRRGDIDTNSMQDDAVMLILGFTGFDFLSRALDRTAPRYIPKAEVLAE